MKLYCDTGNLADFERDDCEGFTTNPSLCKAAGVTDYGAFCNDAVRASLGRPVSLEVTASTRSEIIRQAHALVAFHASGWDGSRVYVKVPVCDAAGHPHYTLIKSLVRDGIRVNVTAVLALEQVEPLADALASDVPAIVSIFAGRIADTGRDPAPIVDRAKYVLRKLHKTKVLWASTRECFNIVQAEEAGADVVTCSPALLDKWKARKGKGLRSVSRDTVAEFERDAKEAGFTL